MTGRYLWPLVFLGAMGLWLAGVAQMGLALLCLLALPPLSWGLNFLGRNRLRLSVELPSTGETDCPIAFELRAFSQFPIPMGPVSCKIEAVNELTGDRFSTSLVLTALAGGEGCRAGQFQSRHCGYLKVTATRVRIWDWFGLLPVPCCAEAHGGVSILPESFPCRAELTVPPAAPEDSVEYAPDQPGWDYSETFQLREYQEGDSLRAVHWKLSGKLDRLVIREPGLPVARTVLVFWDKSAGAPKPEETDALAQVAASLCQALCQQGIGFHLAWNENQTIEFRQIDSLENFCTALPQLIRRGGGEERSGSQLLLERLHRRRYGRIVYLGATPEDAEALARVGNVVALACRAEAAVIPVIPVRLDRYREELQRMELDL